jgi:thioredoxin-like negative regulator of GroEL
MKTIYQTNDTTTPITEVPYIMLYNNGWPVERYVGTADVDAVKNFLIKARAKSTNEQKIEKPSQVSKNPYKVCYLSYDDAYKSSNTLINKAPQNIR